ncbi:replication-relaxation family protein [Paenibacillus sp. D51F]
MENMVSPLIKPQPNNAVPEKPQWDDPFAFVTHISPLPNNDFDFIDRKIQSNWITEREIELVKFLFVHRWLVLAQIKKLFFPDVREDTIRRRIDRMMKFGLIRRVQWTSYSSPGRSRPSMYELGDSGADILKFRFGINPGPRDPRSKKAASMLYRMRYVVTNELYIKLREAFNMVHFEFHPSLVWKEAQVIPTAKYALRTPGGREMPFYLLCHREDEKWVKTIRFQARFFKEYLANVEKETTLVVFVSTDEKALLASKIMEQEGVGAATWFITDKDILFDNVHLSKGFFFYNKGEKTYYDLG